jgi:hypothetical protein
MCRNIHCLTGIQAVCVILFDSFSSPKFADGSYLIQEKWTGKDEGKFAKVLSEPVGFADHRILQRYEIGASFSLQNRKQVSQ